MTGGASLPSRATSTSATRRSTTGTGRTGSIEVCNRRSTAANAELAAAKKRIGEPKTELAISRHAMELLKEQTSPRGGTRAAIEVMAAHALPVQVACRGPGRLGVRLLRAPQQGTIPALDPARDLDRPDPPDPCQVTPDLRRQNMDVEMPTAHADVLDALQSRAATRPWPSDDRRPATGDRRPATGDRRPATGDRRPATAALQVAAQPGVNLQTCATTNAADS